MREFALRLNSAYLENRRSIWICEPESVSDASELLVFLDGERYRDRVGALSVIEELRGDLADSWFVFVSEQSPEARWRDCPCYPPFAGFVGEEFRTKLLQMESDGRTLFPQRLGCLSTASRSELISSPMT